MVVLLIEKDDESRNALTCKGGQKMLGLLKEINMSPDLIITDFQMDDGENGLETASRLQARCGHIPGFILSANRATQLVQDCGHAGPTI